MMLTRLCTLTLVLGVGAFATTFGTNLIVNGDAESYTLVNPGVTFGVADFTDWTRTGHASYVNYPDFCCFHYVTDPGTEAFGAGYFLGGDQASSELTQSIFIGDQSALVDAGRVNFDMRGWLSSARQTATGAIDSVAFSVRFVDGLGNDLGGTGIASLDQAELTALGSPVTSQGYFQLSVSQGLVPAGTRSLDVALLFTRFNGTILNAAADNLGFQLIQTPEPGTFGLLLVALGVLFGIHCTFQSKKCTS